MIKQYVNLPFKAAEHHGRRVSLEATSPQLGPNKIGTSEWWLEPGGANTDPKFLSAAQRCQLQSTYPRNKQDKFRNVVTLPHTGGDRFKIKCSKRGDRSNAHQVEEIEVWRKFYYTVHWMNPSCRRLFSAVQARFENAFKLAFIEAKKMAMSKTRKDEPWTLADPPELPHLYRKTPALAHKPFHLRIVIVRDIYDLADWPYNRGGLSTTSFNIPTPDPLSDARGHPWLASAEARVEPAGPWVNIGAFVRKTGPHAVHVDFSAFRALASAVAAGHTIAVRIRLRVRDHYCGHSLGNFVVVRAEEPGKTPAQVKSCVLQTFTHEVGHGLQQVVEREPLFTAAGARDGSRWETNPKWHTNNYGGQGDHCHTNATLRLAPGATTSGRIYEHLAGTLCTMFFRDDPAVDAAGKFCASCLPRLKRVNLDSRQMRAKNWDWY